MTKDKKKSKNGLIVAICSAIAVIAVIVAIILVVTLGGNKKIDESFFVSDGTKYVLSLDSESAILDYDLREYVPEKMYLVYFYSGDKVTDLKIYYKYSSEEIAKSAVEYLKDKIGEEDSLKDVSHNGAYVIATADESTYGGMTAEEAKQQVEFIEMLQNMEFNNEADIEEDETDLIDTNEEDSSEEVTE